MTLEEVLRCVGEPGAADVMRVHWEESAALLGEAVPNILTAESIARCREWCGFGPEVEGPLCKIAARIAADPALRLLAGHCERLLFEHPDDGGGTGDWPSMQAALGDQRGAFYLLIALGMVPRVIEKHQELGVSDEVTRETCLQVRCFAENYRRGRRGLLGVFRPQLGWLRHYTAGRLFRLGRMEYMLQPFNGGVDVYRHAATGEVLALAPDGMRVNGSGYVARGAELLDDVRTWTVVRREETESVSGFVVSPRGMVVREQVTLPRREWDPVLTKGDTILDMHIPAGGGMTPELCADSMRRAAAFFRERFPDRPFAAVSCRSWIFNTQLDGILPPDSNLVAYQRELYLYPIPSGFTDGLWFLFFQKDFDTSTAPRDTAVQRAVLDFLEAGNAWRSGAMFFMVEHLDRLGTQHYRSHWPPSVLRDAGSLSL